MTPREASDRRGVTWRVALGVGWVALLIAVFGFGPPADPNTADEVVAMLTGRWQGLEPLQVAIFNQLGIWPTLMACLLWAEQPEQRVPYWPFGLLSLATGMYSLIPYLALRDPEAPLRPTRIARWLDSRVLAVALAVGALGLFVYGAAWGDPAAYVELFKAQQLVFAMSVDWILFWLASGALVWQDARRRGATPRFAALAWALPRLGALLYLALRPSLPENA